MRASLESFRLSVEKIAARLMGRSYLRRGRCLQCGKCCRRIVLLHRGKRVACDEDFQALLGLDPRHAWFTPLEGDERGESGERLYRCARLAEDGRCLAYRDRLHLCRTYPHEKILSLGGASIEGCGYSFVPLVCFQEVMDEVLRRR